MEQFLSICSQRKLPACPLLAQWAPSPGQEARGCGRRQEWRKAGFPQPSWDAGPCRQAGQAHPAAVCPRDRRPGLDGQDSGSLRDGQPAWRELGGWASGGWRRGTAWGGERCRRGRRGQLGTEAEGFILPHGSPRKTRVQGPRASYALPEATAPRPGLPPTRHCCRGHRVWGVAGCSLSRPPVSRCPSDAICVLPGAPAPASEGASIPGYRGPELRPRASEWARSFTVRTH